ncbi:MAG: sulfatase-like hydrolase/transferase [Planctomycetota bacterium]
MSTAWESVAATERKLRAYVDGPHRDAERPLFLYLHYRDVHGPYLPPAPYHAMFLPEGWSEEKRRFVDATAELRVGDEVAPWPFEKPVSYALSQYDGEIRYTDDGLARLFDALPSYGVDPANTIVVVTSDHGEEFKDAHPDDRGGVGHGRTLYAEQVRVPLVVVGPGIVQTTVETPVELIDLAPTLSDLAGLSKESARTFRGRSLRPALEGRALESRPVFAGGNHGRGLVHADGRSYLRVARSIGGAPIDVSRRPDPTLEIEYAAQLFVDREDPGQRTNLIDARPKIAARLARELAEHLGGR